MNLNDHMETLKNEYGINNIPTNVLIECSKEVFDLINEEVNYIIPSFELRSEGVTISSVFFVSENFIAETRIDPYITKFDISKKKTICNIMYETQKIISNVGTDSISHKIHNFTFIHTNNIKSVISLIDSPNILNTWKSKIYSAFPLQDLVL